MAALQVPRQVPESEPPRSESEELRIDTAQHTWCFDRLARRFRRVPRGTDPDDPAVQPGWQGYWLLSREITGALTVVLDREGTHRLRVVE